MQLSSPTTTNLCIFLQFKYSNPRLVLNLSIFPTFYFMKLISLAYKKLIHLSVKKNGLVAHCLFKFLRQKSVSFLESTLSCTLVQ